MTAPEASMQAKLVTMTREIAEQLLDRNTRNRSVTLSRVDQYAADMAKGDWQLNGEAVKVGTDGVILDGQHRLMAVCQSNAKVQMLLITGLAPESQETMDGARARSFGDVLKIRGEHDYFNLAAAVRVLTLYENSGVLCPGAGVPTPTIPQQARTLERNPEIRASVKLAQQLRRTWLGQSQIAALHYLFASVSQVDADDFVEKLAKGENIDRSSPIYVLRERLIAERYDPTGIGPKGKLAFIVKAWNAYRRGETIQRLMWVAGGATPDKFPQIDGLAAVANQEIS